MINSVTNNSQIAHAQQTQQHRQNVQAQKNNQKEPPQDTVVLSKKASGAGDADHDGDNH
jgi:hypothetical protein